MNTIKVLLITAVMLSLLAYGPVDQPSQQDINNLPIAQPQEQPTTEPTTWPTATPSPVPSPTDCATREDPTDGSTTEVCGVKSTPVPRVYSKLPKNWDGWVQEAEELARQNRKRSDVDPNAVDIMGLEVWLNHNDPTAQATVTTWLNERQIYNRVELEGRIIIAGVPLEHLGQLSLLDAVIGVWEQDDGPAPHSLSTE